MLDHVSFGVADLDRAAAFYDTALAPLGISRIMGQPGVFAGYGAAGRLLFVIGGRGEAITPIHLAFAAPSQAAVQAFHQAALAAGGRDNGPPGLRPQYSPTYYAAFAYDFDGHNIEAVHRG